MMKSNNMLDAWSSNKMWDEFYKGNLDSFRNTLVDISGAEFLEDGVSEEIEKVRGKILQLRQFEASL
jgi:hypothetical protein